MAVLKDGVHGSFSGKVGNVVGYELNGQAIIRSLPNRKKRKPTPLALINRQRMTAVSGFLRPLKPFIAFGYRHLAPPGSRVGPFQTAQSYTFKHAIDYCPGNVPYVNPEKVLVMRGTLQPPVVTGVKRAGNTINLEFADKIGYIGQNLVLIVYDLETCADMYSVTLRAGTGTCAVELQRGWENARPLHVYAGYHDMLIDELSDSVYLGCF